MRIVGCKSFSMNNHGNCTPQFRAKLPASEAEFEKGYKYIQEYLDTIFGKGVDKISVNDYIRISYSDNTVFRNVSDIPSVQRQHEQIENKQDLIFEALASEAEKKKAKKTKKAKKSLVNALERATGKLETFITQLEISKSRLQMILDAQKDGMLLRGDIFERMKVNYHKAAAMFREKQAAEAASAQRELRGYLKTGHKLN